MNWPALCAVILWGASFIANKIALQELSPVHLILLRAILGSLALDALLLYRGQWSDLAHLSRRDWIRIAGLVLISVFFHQLAQMVGLQKTTAINGALLITLSPLFMFMLSTAFLGERAQWRTVLGFLMAILGAALVISRGEIGVLYVDRVTIMGDLLIIVSAGGWALYSILGKGFVQKHPPLLMVALVFSLSIPILIALGHYRGENFIAPLFTLSWQGWGAVFFLAWGCSALAYVLWYGALQKRKVSHVGIFQYIQPVVATLLGIVILHETVTWATVIGGIIVLGGVTLVTR